MNDETIAWISGFFIFLVVCGIIIVGAFALKATNPWWAEVTGRAELARAEQNRKIAIIEAEAKLESAKKLAEADIERAKGIAEANRIISNSLTEEYLKYKFIEGLNDGNTEVIYVPTEANLPILEARDKRLSPS